MTLHAHKYSLGLACLISSLALVPTTGCTDSDGAADPQAAPPATLSGDKLAERLTIEAARPGKEYARITLPAEVVLAPQADHKLASSMDGKLVKWLVQPGETVEIGQPLAELVARELTDLRASENELSQLVKERQKIVDSLQEQVELGVQPITTLQEAQAALSEARGRLQTLRSHAASRRNLGVSSAKNGSRWTWVATVSGTIAQIECSPGQLLDPQTTCITILNTNAPQVRVAVPQRLVSGAPDTIDHSTALFSTLDQDPDDKKTRKKLTWHRKSPIIDPESRTQSHYFLTTAAADADELLPGTSGRLTIIANEEKADASAPPILLVPRLAVTLIEDKPHVFYWEKNAAHPIPVKVIGQFDDNTLIQGEGISEGTQIVTRGVFLLKSQLVLSEEEED